LRGLGWVFGIVCVGFAVAMISGLLGIQSQAPAFAVPDTADTTPPSQYVNAALPSPPGKTKHVDRASAIAAAGPTVTASPSSTVTRTGTVPRTGVTTGTDTRAGNGTTVPTSTP
jgi:hypothetical protein